MIVVKDTMSHGDNSKCSDVQAGVADRCPGHVAEVRQVGNVKVYDSFGTSYISAVILEKDFDGRDGDTVEVIIRKRLI